MNTHISNSANRHLAIPSGNKRFLGNLLHAAGIVINGSAPWDIQIYDDRVYNIAKYRGPLGMGEAYMDGLWDVQHLDEFYTRVIKANVDLKVYTRDKITLLLGMLQYRFFNMQTKSRSLRVACQHYDVGNSVFETMLDSSMTYSCAYWQNAATLEQAQRNKLDLICRKLELKQGDKLLDIGCGWGGLAEYAATHYQAEVTGITISRQQFELAQQRCHKLPVSILLRDYRDIGGQYDKIVSVGMFEHVGPKNYARFFDIVHRSLRDNGLFLLHTIGKLSYSSYSDPWIQKYIFPNGKIPAAKWIVDALKNQFIVEDWHSFGMDYDRTLIAWWHNFQSGWKSLQEEYDERFYRMWKYYLLSCAAYFRARRGQLWQIILSKPQRTAMYRSVR